MKKYSELYSRKGKVQFTPEFLRETDYELLKKIFSLVIPIGIQDWMSSFGNIVTYYCISPEFEKLEEGNVIPYYMINVENIYDENQLRNHLKHVIIDYKITVKMIDPPKSF